MKKTVLKKQPLAIALGVLLAGAGAINQLHAESFELIPSASAAQGEEGKGKGAGGAGGAGGKGSQGAGGQGGGAGGSSSLEGSVLKGKKAISTEADDDSDRPDWAGGDKELNPHRGEGNPNPGDMKGGDYGDLYIIYRADNTGDPILNAGGFVQPIAFYDANPDPLVTELVMITDAAGNPVLLDLNEEGEVIAGQTKTLPDGTVVTAVTSEVEFGRANIVRSPDKVTQHALDEATSKILAGTTVTLDPVDGRLVIDGAKIDSPLENMALYIALVNGTLDPAVVAKLPDATLDFAATLLAAGGDKTADIKYVDYVYYLNNIMDLSPDLTTFSYDRSDYTTMNVTYLYYTDATQTATASATVNIADYLSWINGDITDGSGIEGFTAAVDDGVELIEFTHTAVFPYELTEANVAP